MTYSTEAIQAFWALMRMGKPKPFLVRRLLQRLDRDEIDERTAAEWLAVSRSDLRVRPTARRLTIAWSTDCQSQQP